MHPRVLKELTYEVADLPTKIRTLIKTTTMPDDGRIDNIVPMFKKDLNVTWGITDQICIWQNG